MSRITVLLMAGVMLMMGALPGYCGDGGTTLWQDAETGQLFTKPADGRVPMDAVKDLKMPETAIGGLYEDENGAVYAKPGAGRTPVALATERTTDAASSGPADYSGAAFAEAVKHVVSEEESKTYPKVKLGSEAYFGYSYDFDNENLNSDKSRKNKFSLNRGYINMKAELAPWLKVRLTPDITRMTGATAKGLPAGASVTDDDKGNFEFRLKFLYANFHDFWEAYPSFNVKLGQFEGAWLDHIEHLWTYRVQGTMFIEREGYMNSSNLGVNLGGELPSGYGEWQANFVNGEGYHADENNKYKSAQGRLTLHPLPDNEYTRGIEVTGFGFVGQRDRLTKRNMADVLAGYKYKDVLFVGGEYLWTRGADSRVAALGRNNIPGAGYSVMGWYRMPFHKPLRLMGRYDHMDHDTANADTDVSRYIYGASYDIGKNVVVLVNNERTNADKGVATVDENLFKLDVLFKF